MPSLAVHSVFWEFKTPVVEPPSNLRQWRHGRAMTGMILMILIMVVTL